MTRIIVDESTANQLKNQSGQAELCDNDGNTLGRFVPLIDLSEWEPLTPDITEEELQRRLNSNEPRYTTAQVLAHLEKLDGPR